MATMKTTTIRLLTGTLLIAGALLAQEGLSGHWTGSIELPNMSMVVEIDLDKTAKGWVGSMNIPAQNAMGVPLEAITFADGKASWRIKGTPSTPTFTGTLAADGKTLAGDFTQGSGTFPFKLSRAGAAKVEEAKKSPRWPRSLSGRGRARWRQGSRCG